MNRRDCISGTASMLLAGQWVIARADPDPQAAYVPTQENLEAREWFQEIALQT